MPGNDLRNRGREGAAESGAAGPGIEPHGLATDADLARLLAAWPALAEPIRRAILALVDTAGPSGGLVKTCHPGAKGDTGEGRPGQADLDRAFDRLDRQGGGHNFVSLALLRPALPGWDRAALDGLLHQLRRAGRYSLAAAEGRHGLTAAERQAGIAEDGQLLLYVCRKSP